MTFKHILPFLLILTLGCHTMTVTFIDKEGREIQASCLVPCEIECRDGNCDVKTEKVGLFQFLGTVVGALAVGLS